MNLELLIVLIACLVILSVLLQKLAQKLKIPQAPLLILLGFLLNLYLKKDLTSYSQTINVIATIALVLILFDSASLIKLKDLKINLMSSFLMAIVAVIFSLVIISLSSYYLLGLSLKEAVLIGAILSSTDLMVISPHIKRLAFPKQFKLSVYFETLLNSPLSILIATTYLSFQLTGTTTNIPLETIKIILYRFFVGAVLGALFGLITYYIIKNLEVREKPHIISLGALLICYSLTQLLDADGFIAAFLFGITIGNLRPLESGLIKLFEGDIQLLLVTAIFFIFGFLVAPQTIKQVGIYALIFTIVLAIARYLSILLVYHKESRQFRLTRLFFQGRGIVPAVLILSFTAHLKEPQKLLAIVLLTIVLTILVEAFLKVFVKDLPKEAQETA